MVRVNGILLLLLISESSVYTQSEHGTPLAERSVCLSKVAKTLNQPVELCVLVFAPGESLWAIQALASTYLHSLTSLLARVKPLTK